MIVETTLLLDRWLQHTEHGFVSMMLALPRNDPEGNEFDMPPEPLLYNDVEDEEVAGEIDPPSEVSLVLFCDSDADVQSANSNRQIARQLTIAVAYITRDTPSNVAVRNGGFTLRAVKKSLLRFNDQGLSRDFRELNGIKVMQINSISEQRVAGAVGRSQLWGFVLTSVMVIDSNS